MKRKILEIIFLFIPLIILNIISLLNMLNAKLISSVYNNAFYKQLIWFVIGYLLIFILKKYKLKRIFAYSKYLYFLSSILLILVLFIGSNINGAKCWINILGISFQPSEFMKISMALYMSYIAINNTSKNIKDQLIHFIKLLLLFIFPSILVFLEPDTGAIISFFIIYIISLFNSKLNKWWYYVIVLLTSLLIIIFLIMYLFYQDILINIIGTSLFYRMDRIINFINNNSYQLENALITIGSTSFFKFNPYNILIYIPEAPTDFIFAFSCGNYGIFSALLIILSYILIDIYLIIRIDLLNNNYKLFTKVYLGLLLFREFYNILMNIGLLPIMGIPLPFLSYGGTNTIINYLFISIIINKKLPK